MFSYYFLSEKIDTYIIVNMYYTNQDITITITMSTFCKMNLGLEGSDTASDTTSDTHTEPTISERMEGRDYVDFIEDNFREKKENKQIYPYPSLPRTIQSNEMAPARDLIYKFITEKKTPSVCHYGNSSWGVVGHNLFYDREGVLYGFYGRTLPEYDMTAFTVHRTIIEDMFEYDDPRKALIEKMDF